MAHTPDEQRPIPVFWDGVIFGVLVIATVVICGAIGARMAIFSHWGCP